MLINCFTGCYKKVIRSFKAFFRKNNTANRVFFWTSPINPGILVLKTCYENCMKLRQNKPFEEKSYMSDKFVNT